MTRVRARADQYRAGHDRPLSGYVATLATYAGVTGGLTGLAALLGRRPPERLSAGDVALMSMATHKLSRLITKDSVTAPLRMPFARYERPIGEGEVAEQVRGEGLAHAAGELLTCPFCVSVWVATGFAAGMVFAPRLTRLVAATFTAVAVSDIMQLGYATARQLPGLAEAHGAGQS